MLLKIIWKNFKYNLGNYILFFISQMMAVTMLFSFLGLKYALAKGIQDSLIRYIIGMQYIIAAGIIIIIAIFLMVFSMKYYMKVRIRDYGMFLTLGMKRSMVFQMLLTEYGIGILISPAGGLLLGNGLLFGWQKILKQIDSTYRIYMDVPFSIYRNTILLSVGILIGALLVMLVMIGEKNVSDLAQDKQKREIRPKGMKWSLCILLGMALVVFGGYVYRRDVSRGPDRAILIWVAAVFLLLYFGVGMGLELLKKQQWFYFRNILHLNQLYHQYSSNYLIMYALTLIHFLAIGYLAADIASSLPLMPDRAGYQYDAVWCSASENEACLDSLEEKYEAVIERYPMMSVTQLNMVQQAGISESTYQKITGRKASLEGNEVLYAVQYSGYVDSESEEDMKGMCETLHIGRFRIALNRSGGFPGLTDTRLFQPAEVKKLEVLPVLGEYSLDGWHSNVIVFSDEFFQKGWEEVTERGDEQELLALMNFPGNERERAVADLKTYEEKEGVQNDLTEIMPSNLFITEEFRQSQKQLNTFGFASRSIILFALVFGSLFTIGMKGFSMLSSYRRQDEFLYCMGMSHRARKKVVKKEIGNIVRLPLFFGALMGFVYMGCYQWAYRPARYGDYTFWKCWGLVFAAYIFIIYICAWLLSRYLVKNVEEAKHECY